MSALRDASGRVRSGWVVLVFAVVAVAVEAGALVLFTLAGELVSAPRLFFLTLPSLLAGTVATLVAWLAFREPTGLRDPTPLAQLGLGLLFGAAAISVACLGPVLAGATSLGPSGDEGLLMAGLWQAIALAPAGIGEELLLRGLGLQALRRGLGDVAAVVLSSVLFGVLHLGNPNATPVAALIIVLVGLWFGAVRLRSGSLWMPIGLHLAWNLFEGFVFGQPVSGNLVGPSLLVSPLTEAGFWSGGAFGPEASGWTAVVLCLALAATLLVRNNRAP